MCIIDTPTITSTRPPTPTPTQTQAASCLNCTQCRHLRAARQSGWGSCRCRERGNNNFLYLLAGSMWTRHGAVCLPTVLLAQQASVINSESVCGRYVTVLASPFDCILEFSTCKHKNISSTRITNRSANVGKIIGAWQQSVGWSGSRAVVQSGSWVSINILRQMGFYCNANSWISRNEPSWV